MTIELDDNETRLLYNVLLHEAEEHWSYCFNSEVAFKLYELATRFERPDRHLQAGKKT